MLSFVYFKVPTYRTFAGRLGHSRASSALPCPAFPPYANGLMNQADASTALNFPELNLWIHQNPGCLSRRQELAIRAQECAARK